MRQQLQYLQEKKMGENPRGNRELNYTRTHDRQLHHPEHLPNELRLVPPVLVAWWCHGPRLPAHHLVPSGSGRPCTHDGA